MAEWNDKFQGGLCKNDHVHVWKASFEYNESKVNSAIKVLSREEMERANRFHFEKDRIKFVMRRSALKQIIGKYLEIDPKNLVFGYNRFGKPVLVSDSLKHDLRFNMSHSNNMALYCFGFQRDVGIDIEFIIKDVEFQKIIDSFFSINEKEFIRQVSVESRKEMFFKIWTRKEAILKALGQGISFPLRKVNVPDKKNKFIIDLHDVNNQCEKSFWYVQDLLPSNNYIASIAIEGSNSEIFLSHYTL